MSRSCQRVVVTGVGILSCFGVGAQVAWRQVLAGRSGITAVKDPTLAKISSRVYGKVPWASLGDNPNNNDAVLFDPDKFASKAEQREMGPAGLYAINVAEEALRDADWFPKTAEDRERSGVVLGTGMCDMRYVQEVSIAIAKTGSYNRLSPYYIPRVLLNIPAANVSIRFGLQGVQHSQSTACAISTHAIGDAFRMLRDGDCDVIVAGGCEANLNPLTLAGFSRMRALSTKYNSTPITASRPFDVGRDGFVIADGGACLVLETLEHFKRRSAAYVPGSPKQPRIYAEILGYGVSADAYHVSAPAEDGNGARRSIQAALRDAGVSPSEVTHINCHATSTPLGDLAEIRAICDAFRAEPEPSGEQTNAIPSQVLINSTKGATGHLLGGAGAIECAFTALAVRDGVVAPSINSEKIDPKIETLLSNFNSYSKRVQLQIANKNKFTEWKSVGGKRRIALKNSFGFGGTNGTVCFASFQE